MNLCLIPRIDSKASSGYSAESSFHYTYDSYDYYFYFDGSHDTVSGYYFQEDALNTVIEKSAEFININIVDYLGNKINFLLNKFTSSIFNLVKNFMIATNKAVQDWFTNQLSLYGWNFELLSTDPNYPGHETYGTAYGWRFDGLFFDQVDIVLDAQGHLYGSNPIGNITGSEDIDEFSQWSIHQFDGDDIWYQPTLPSSSSNSSLPRPYIDGKSLYFYIQGDQQYQPSSWFRVVDFTNTFISVGAKTVSGRYYIRYYFISPSHSLTVENLGTVGFTSNWVCNNRQGSTNMTIDCIHGQYSGTGYYTNLESNGEFSSIMCSSYLPNWSYAGTNPGNQTHYDNNYLGFVNNVSVSGSDDIYLAELTTTPVPNFPDVPDDEPIPFGSLDPDPDDYVPDQDPDDVPGGDYPVPEPIPVPVPQLPSIISGNDDLWPDMNGFFDAENELDGFLGPLRDFDFGSFSNITAQFSSALVWVSTIMMTLFDGSDFNILFSILAVFFIACALLGIYKWWNS